jgi:hypothetical protein
MQVVMDEEMRTFLNRHDDLRCEGRQLRFDHQEAKTIIVDLRVSEPHQLVYLARLAAHLSYDEAHFRGASLWITQWGVWDSQVEAVGFRAMERIRQGYGETRSLNTAPGHFFRHDEFVESIVCLVQPMLVWWDGLLRATVGGWFGSLSVREPRRLLGYRNQDDRNVRQGARNPQIPRVAQGEGTVESLAGVQP